MMTDSTLRKCKVNMILPSEFHALWWLRNPHMQTLFAARMRTIAMPPITQERLTTPDNDFLDLHWFGNKKGPLVILFHGLEGSSRSNYARGLMHSLTAVNLGGAVMHFRGCSGEPNRQRQSYHCGHTHDIAWVLNQLADKYPRQELIAVGFSLGGAALLNTLATETLPEQLKLSLVVSPPFEPRSSAHKMNRGFSRLYQHTLIRDCISATRAKLAAGVALPIDLEKLDKIKTFWAFDQHITAPLHGFENADDYYEQVAPRQRLNKITRACHIIHARDDPFFEESMIPTEGELGENTTLELCSRGGHMAFVSGKYWSPHFWLENRLRQLITESFNGLKQPGLACLLLGNYALQTVLPPCS